MDEPKVAVLRHYASPYYDPQKAHEYYIRSFHFQNGKVNGAKSSYLKSRRQLKKPLIIYAV